jgi:hypothetical protein
MMDFDDVNCKNVRPEILQKYLLRNDWDALSFNSRPKYYDIWALSIYPYCFSTHYIIMIIFYSVSRIILSNGLYLSLSKLLVNMLHGLQL